MKTTAKYTAIIIGMILLLTSCSTQLSIQKRRYFSGFNVDFVSNNDKRPQTSLTLDSINDSPATNIKVESAANLLEKDNGSATEFGIMDQKIITKKQQNTNLQIALKKQVVTKLNTRKLLPEMNLGKIAFSIKPPKKNDNDYNNQKLEPEVEYLYIALGLLVVYLAVGLQVLTWAKLGIFLGILFVLTFIYKLKNEGKYCSIAYLMLESLINALFILLCLVISVYWGQLSVLIKALYVIILSVGLIFFTFIILAICGVLD